jgi:hypothetical protein
MLRLVRLKYLVVDRLSLDTLVERDVLFLILIVRALGFRLDIGALRGRTDALVALCRGRLGEVLDIGAGLRCGRGFLGELLG